MAEMLAVLLRHYGAQNWWPGRTPFEVIIGAFLVQNTAWKNAEKALRNLRRARALSPAAIRRASLRQVEEWVRPAGYFRQKAARLKSFVGFLDARYGGSTKRMFQQETTKLRSELMTLPGVGEETADAILLYAGGHRVFVADAYAKRIAQRHGLHWKDYQQVNRGFGAAVATLPPQRLHRQDPCHPPSMMSRSKSPVDVRLLKETHAVIVRVGSEFCRPQARCGECPLAPWLPAEPGKQAL